MRSAFYLVCTTCCSKMIYDMGKDGAHIVKCGAHYWQKLTKTETNVTSKDQHCAGKRENRRRRRQHRRTRRGKDNEEEGEEEEMGGQQQEPKPKRHFPAFPFDPYTIQIDFMNFLYDSLDSGGGIAMLESPTGTR